MNAGERDAGGTFVMYPFPIVFQYAFIFLLSFCSRQSYYHYYHHVSLFVALFECI
jgi:hypothetical protein